MLQNLPLAILLASSAALLYHGEIDLPVELYTTDGISLGPGKFQVKIRQESQRYALVFLNEGKQAAKIMSVPAGVWSAGVPLAPTTLLWPPPQEKAEIRSKISPYLANLCWEATLRVYRSAEPSGKEIRAIFQAPTKQIEFPLFLEKPAMKRSDSPPNR